MGSGRKKGIEWEHVSKIEDSIRVSCDYCHESSSSLFEGYPLQVRHKQDWGQGFILLPQVSALPESDAGSDVIKPALSFIEFRHIINHP